MTAWCARGSLCGEVRQEHRSFVGLLSKIEAARLELNRRSTRRTYLHVESSAGRNKEACGEEKLVAGFQPNKVMFQRRHREVLRRPVDGEACTDGNTRREGAALRATVEMPTRYV